MFAFLLKLFKVDTTNRKAVGYFEGIFSIIINLIITAIKLGYAFISGSISLLADAVHSLSDIISSIIVIVSFKMSTKDPDINHPFGHGRIENITSIIIATLLMVVGFEFIAKSIEKIVSPEPIHIDNIGLTIVAFTIILKEFLARLSIYLGKLINSNSLIAEGHHHRSDALSTIIVIIGFVGNNYDIAYADGVAGLLVSLFIFHTAYDLIKDASQALMGQKPDKEILKHIKQTVKKYSEALGVHDVIVHDFGSIFNISLHVEVPDSMDIVKAHELADKIEKDIAQKYKGHVVVHLDPVNTEHPLYHKIKDFLREELAQKYPFFETAHDIRIVGNDQYFNIVFDINLPAGKDVSQALKEAKTLLKNEFGANDVSINPDLPLAG